MLTRRGFITAAVSLVLTDSLAEVPVRLFGKYGRELDNPPMPSHWRDIRRSIGRWDFCPFPKTTVLNDIARVHDFVDSSIREVRDNVIYGVEERWAYPGQVLDRMAGDCEDHAILKWAFLHAMGYSDFVIATVYDLSQKEGHAVLVHLSENGNVVMDNLVRNPYYDHHKTGFIPQYAYGLSRNWSFL